MKSIRLKDALALVIGSAILAFGLFNIHSFSGVTEGGTLGLTLLFENLISLSPAVSSIVLNAICYLIGFRLLGKKFILKSAVSAGSFAIFYFAFELIGPLFPEIASHPLAASLLGALFVGVGVGLAVRAGGAPSGDDALAMSLSSLFKVNISLIYLISDALVLSLSLIYIPIDKILYSLLTVVLSGQIINIVSSLGKKKQTKPEKAEENISPRSPDVPTENGEGAEHENPLQGEEPVKSDALAENDEPKNGASPKIENK